MTKDLLRLRLWKCEVMVLVLICGGFVFDWVIKIVVFCIKRNFLLRKKLLYFVYDAVEESLKSLNLFHGGVVDKQAGKYSGGMKKRLSVAISLAGDPRVCTQKFELPKEDVKIGDVFQVVDAAKRNFIVFAWGLVDTTLEDVFIKVARGAQAFETLS
ncbi:hypothetical protein Fmac_026345 [Flemingia macrophylla]|uniref:Uncharacterized protein n=1 Tax=Flemingia macrophylla TaxID=520843 RepID=A0ABD1LES4_9FABA